MPEKKLHIESAFRSDIGRIRRQNEDAVGFDASLGMYVVCDGMGGAAAGDLASRMALDVFLTSLRQKTLMPRSVEEQMEDGILKSNAAVYQYAAEHPRLRGMGTTLIALHLPLHRKKTDLEVPLVVAHVGDSRCYRLRDGRLQQMTVDHSLVAEQVRMGTMTQAEADVSPMRNVITRAIGTQMQIEPEVQTLTGKDGDLYLLCSDGLIHDLTEKDLQPVLNQRGVRLDALAQQLVSMANHAGGRDNTTVLLVRLRF